MIEAVVAVALRAILASLALGGVLAALVFLATRLLALNASTRHALWTTALIAMGVMPLAGIGVSLLKAGVAEPAPSPHAIVAPHQPDLRAATPAHHELTAAIPAGHTASRASSSRPSASAASSSQSSASQISDAKGSGASAAAGAAAGSDAISRWQRFVAGWTAPKLSRRIAIGLVAVWALGVLIGLIGLATSVMRVRGLKKRSSPLDAALADELLWLTAVGPGREIYLRLSFEIETPVAIGFNRPVILIPTELATADGLAAIESLILHENAHLRRYDDWTNLVQRAIERTFWFNPIVWLVGRRIALEREIASDDAVVEKTGEPHAYATSLWQLAREMRMPEHAVVAPGALLTRKQISVRIEQLLDKRRTSLHRSPVAALGVAFAGLLAVGAVATSAPAVELPAAPPALAVKDTASNDAIAEKDARTGTPAVAHHHAAAQAAAVPAVSVAAQHAPVAAEHAPVAALHQPALSQPGAPAAHRVSPERAAQKPPQIAQVQTVSAPPAPPAPQVTARTAAPPTGARDDGSSNDVVDAKTRRALAVASAAASAASAAAAHAGGEGARIGAELGTRIGTDVSRAVVESLTSIPHDARTRGPRQVAQVNGSGIRASRDLLASCTGCTLRNADLRNLDLHGLKLNGLDLRGANLSGANLSGARLTGVNLRDAVLTGTNLRGAELNGVDLGGANLDGALLDDVKLIGISLRSVSLHGTMLRGVVQHCVGCDLSGLDLHGQDLHGITLTGADLSRTDLHDANLSNVRFVGVDLSGANLNGADLTGARLDGCDLSHAALHGTKMTGISLHGTDIDD